MVKELSEQRQLAATSKFFLMVRSFDNNRLFWLTLPIMFPWIFDKPRDHISLSQPIFS